MSVLNLNDCFPEPMNGGERGPLPKQAELLKLALDMEKAKYIRYIGGIGSGKTLIGCITVLCWAVLYPGTYLIGRQFFPELRDTTLKCFLEVCPKDLIVEHRVADAIVKIRSTDGKVSEILFRQMEEPDKLRSLNLNGFYIDESCQVTEAAFLLLQGRLRGRHVRKGILTTNSDGRGWGWRYFVQKSMFKDEKSKALFVNIKAPSTENTHLPEGYVETMLNTWSEQRIRREILADEEIFEGAVYPEFRRDVHIIKPFRIPDDWTRFVGADHGWTNPTAWVWGAVDRSNN
jgi:phage terminase large subunit